MELISLNQRFRFLKYLLPLAIGALLLAFPLVRSFHLDSAMVAGVFGAFAGAWIASRSAARDRDAVRLTALVYFGALPLVVRDLMVGCLSSDGVAFWIFIPSFSIFFGFSIGRLFRFLTPEQGRRLAMVAVLIVLAGGSLLVLYLFPQLYFFNHILGYWPGPIYDESVTFPGRLVLYRTITLTWTGVFWMIPHLKGSDRIVKGIFLMLILSLAIHYSLSAHNGLVSPRAHIQSILGGEHHTENFSLYYSKAHYSADEAAYLGQLHEFHFREIIDTLGVSWPQDKRVESYLYGHEWQLQTLTGAKGVSFVPVWQNRPQVHIRKSALSGTLRHELVHVVAREFGNPLLNASWNIGLTEGLAVALAPASSTRLTTDQLVVSNNAFYSGEDIERLFSLSGFYRESGSVAYAVSGSFVATLLQDYSVDRFKTAYRHSSLKRGYKEVFSEAIGAWHDKLGGVEVTPGEKELAETIFAVPSIFESKCPRKVSVVQSKREAFRYALAERDTMRAVRHLEEVLAGNSDWPPDWRHWMRLKLESGRPQEIIDRRDQLPDHPLVTVRLADAYMAANRIDEALALQSKALGREDLPEQAKSEWRLRNNPDRWAGLVAILYRSSLSLEQPPAILDEDGDGILILAYFAEWFRRNPVPVPGSATTRKDDTGAMFDRQAFLVDKVLHSPIRESFFETYRNLLLLLSYTNPQANTMDTIRPAMVPALAETEWRPVRKERLEEAIRFARFMKTRSMQE